MTRLEFSVATKKAAWKRADGTCECGCGQPFDLNHPKGCPEYHHRIEAGMGGRNDIENCLCIRSDCHKVITAEESAPKMAKIRREDNRRRGTARKKKKIPYRRFDGTPVWKD